MPVKHESVTCNPLTRLDVPPFVPRIRSPGCRDGEEPQAGELIDKDHAIAQIVERMVRHPRVFQQIWVNNHGRGQIPPKRLVSKLDRLLQESNLIFSLKHCLGNQPTEGLVWKADIVLHGRGDIWDERPGKVRFVRQLPVPIGLRVGSEEHRTPFVGTGMIGRARRSL